MVTNNKEYQQNYMKNQYHTNKKYKEKQKERTYRRVKAMGILAKRHHEEFMKIFKELVE